MTDPTCTPHTEQDCLVTSTFQPTTENDEWLESHVAAGFRVWQIMFLCFACLLTLVIFLCCCFRFRIPRTKQEIEADYVRKKLTKKFQKHLRVIQNSEMDNMDLKRAKGPKKNLFLNPTTLEDEGTMFLKTSEDTNPVTQCHIPESFSHQQSRCDNFKSGIVQSSHIHITDPRIRDRISEQYQDIALDRVRAEIKSDTDSLAHSDATLSSGCCNCPSPVLPASEILQGPHHGGHGSLQVPKKVTAYHKTSDVPTDVSLEELPVQGGLGSKLSSVVETSLTKLRPKKPEV